MDCRVNACFCAKVSSEYITKLLVMKHLFLILYFPLVWSCVSKQTGEGKSVYKVDLVEKPVSVSSIKDIRGFFGHRMEVNRDIYLTQFPIDKYVEFIEKREHTEWIWTQAEQHGKWVESAYLSAIQGENEELLAKADTILKRIIHSQEEEGYVGATARSYRSPERPLRGMDPYELYFVIHAFITVYEETGDPEALTAAEKLSDYILRYIGPGKLEFWPSDLRDPENRHKVLTGHSHVAGHAVHYSWEGTMLIDPMLRLYEKTGKKDYLEWGRWIVANIDGWSGWDAFSNLDRVADGTMGVHELQPYVHSHTFHMNFMGFLRLYRITGDPTLFRKVKGAWDDIAERQMYITGGVSVAEHYEPGYIKPLAGNVVETCATMSWMQLTQALLELTGEVKYADAMERLMINHVFAAQDGESGICRYHTAPNGTKPAGYFHGPDCCTASGHRIISLLPSFFYAEKGNDFYINQYLPASYKGGDFGFEVITQYPETENTEIRITSEKAVAKNLNLRIPAWSKTARATLNGKEVSAVPGTYLRLSGKWKKGDKIELVFPMDVHWVKRENHSEYIYTTLPGGEHVYTETPTDRIPYALLRGPVVYVLDMVWNGQIGRDSLDFEKDIRLNTDVDPVQAEKPDPKMLGPVYEAKALYQNRETTVLLTPFANIGQWYRPGFDKPDKNKKAYSYAIWTYN
jgi:DUF1680 family protein